MNNLQRLLKLRGLTIQRISDEIGQGYHITQKVIKRATYKRKDGSIAVRSSKPVEDGVARLLGLSHAEVWGNRSDITLRRLIKEEIKTQARQQEKKMRNKYLPNCKIPKKQTIGNV